MQAKKDLVKNPFIQDLINHHKSQLARKMNLINSMIYIQQNENNYTQSKKKFNLFCDHLLVLQQYVQKLPKQLNMQRYGMQLLMQHDGQFKFAYDTLIKIVGGVLKIDFLCWKRKIKQKHRWIRFMRLYHSYDMYTLDPPSESDSDSNSVDDAYIPLRYRSRDEKNFLYIEGRYDKQIEKAIGGSVNVFK